MGRRDSRRCHLQLVTPHRAACTNPHEKCVEVLTHLHLSLCEQVAYTHTQATAEGQERPSLLAFLRQPPLGAEVIWAHPALGFRPPLIILEGMSKIQKHLPSL